MAQTVHKRLVVIEEEIKARNRELLHSVIDGFIHGCSREELTAIRDSNVSAELNTRFAQAVKEKKVVDPDWLEDVIEGLRLQWHRW